MSSPLLSSSISKVCIHVHLMKDRAVRNLHCGSGEIRRIVVLTDIWEHVQNLAPCPINRCWTWSYCELLWYTMTVLESVYDVKYLPLVYYDKFQEHKCEHSSHALLEVLLNLRHSWRICAEVLRTFVQTHAAVRFRVIMTLIWQTYLLNVSYYHNLLSFTMTDISRHYVGDAARLRSTTRGPPSRERERRWASWRIVTQVIPRKARVEYDSCV
jgi:hypothetical protein